MRQRPLLTWAAAFAAGIGLGALGYLPLSFAWVLAGLGIGCLLATRKPGLFPLALLLLGVSAGALRLAAFEKISPTDVSQDADTPAPVTLTGTVVSDPIVRRGGVVTFYFQAARSETHGVPKSVTGEVAVTAESAAKTALDYGDALRLEGTLETPLPATNPGAFSWHDYLARRGIYAELRVKRPGAVQYLGASRRNPFLRLAWIVRRHVLRVLSESLPPTGAAVLSGILIGQRSDLSPDLMAEFVQTGTVHILASAGLHVGILLFWLERLLQKITVPRKLVAVLLIAAVVLYALVCGGRPAVVRAALMAALYYGAILVEREPDLPTAVGAAGLVILLLQPTALLEPGFQMSFLTIFTLSLTMPVWDSFWRPRLAAWIKWPLARTIAIWAVEMVGLSVLAQLGALPVVALSYNEVSGSGWLANLLVVPMLFVLIPLALAGILLAGLWNAGGLVLLTAAGWGTERLVGIVHLFAALRGASFAVPSPSLPLIFMTYGLVYGGADVIRKQIDRQNAPPSAAAGTAAASSGAAPLVGIGPPP